LLFLPERCVQFGFGFGDGLGRTPAVSTGWVRVFNV
jgi:hypothetical protein